MFAAQGSGCGPPHNPTLPLQRPFPVFPKQFALQQQKDKSYDVKEHVNTSDDVGCLDDVIGLEIGDGKVDFVESQHDWSQQQSNSDGIQIVVQEHVDYQWDTGQVSSSRRGKF